MSKKKRFERDEPIAAENFPNPQIDLPAGVEKKTEPESVSVNEPPNLDPSLEKVSELVDTAIGYEHSEEPEETEMTSQEKIEQLKNWMVPQMKKFALEIVYQALTGKIKAGESRADVERKLQTLTEDAAQKLAYKLAGAVKEIRI